MTDDTNGTQNGDASPFGAMKINFGGAADASPAGAQRPQPVRRHLDHLGRPGRDPRPARGTRSATRATPAAPRRKVLIIGSGPAGPDRGDLRRARQPPADRARGLHARRPADAHQRRRELPGLPGRHRRPRADGEVPRARPSASARRSSTSTSTGSTSRSRPFRVWARGTEYRAQSRDHRDRRVGAVARPRERAAPPRPRRLGLRHLRRVLLPRPRDRGRRRRRLRDGGGELTSPSSRARSTCSTGARRSARRRS